MLPAPSSLIAWTYCDERVFATYIVRSSGDSASPFGYSQCASTVKLPSGADDKRVRHPKGCFHLPGPESRARDEGGAYLGQ